MRRRNDSVVIIEKFKMYGFPKKMWCMNDFFSGIVTRCG